VHIERDKDKVRAVLNSLEDSLIQNSAAVVRAELKRLRRRKLSEVVTLPQARWTHSTGETAQAWCRAWVGPDNVDWAVVVGWDRATEAEIAHYCFRDNSKATLFKLMFG
jgi:uncharacterized protein involved in copper resistance